MINRPNRYIPYWVSTEYLPFLPPILKAKLVNFLSNITFTSLRKFAGCLKVKTFSTLDLHLAARRIKQTNFRPHILKVTNELSYREKDTD